MIVDHGVPARIISECWEASVEFFDRPLDEKRAVPMTEEYPYGYQARSRDSALTRYPRRLPPRTHHRRASGWRTSLKP